ncbi:MAG: tyrosine-protein phosphatase [Tractidigestivibacter sp.]|jgi:protein-tyrosine phosphatase|uniref:tyrosine-protein phosphatase n=1 Tax=Tractidigestivibacter sp. TaxID=2847320 RepID=UPI003D924F6A
MSLGKLFHKFGKEPRRSQANGENGHRSSAQANIAPLTDANGQPLPIPDGGVTLPVAENCRELGGYPTPDGGTTLTHRFLRSGSTSMLRGKDLSYLLKYGVRRVVDLRSQYEVDREPDRLASSSKINYVNIPLYGQNLHDKRLDRVSSKDDYLTSGYLRMLGNHEAVRQIFTFFSEANDDECVLFHCAAGMDRTGITAMLLLGAAGIDKHYIIADYIYSFGSKESVDAYLWQGAKPSWNSTIQFKHIIETVYLRLCEAYGTPADYLLECGLMPEQIRAVREHLMGRQGN